MYEGSYAHSVLPADQYALSECYCVDPECDCRRVVFNVVGLRQKHRGFLATIGYGFDRDAEMAGPYLDPLNSQSEYAETLFDLVSDMLASDADYVKRLQAHYRQVKDALKDPNHEIHRQLSMLGMGAPSRPRSKKRRKRRK